MVAEAEEVPEGYAPYSRRSSVTDPWLPLFAKTEAGAVNLALCVRSAHCNGKGFLHGGVMSALADNAMGLSVIETLSRQGTKRGRSGSTVNLSLSFLSSAQVGQWVVFAPRVLKVGSGIGFVECLILADSQVVARGNGIYRFYEETHSDVARS